ncbi:DNA polymerase III subunit beta [Bradyrhizobium sp. 186]|uniref:DNA polymerase III subunit beta n=1 Tax=Bradyrhizobium sp. 186 TaxID=2782654 RepID=UPI002000F21D|nr:DNA polymerase III subunit beta [Bradyrhizobium sp. 186]UPK31844.1 DNA polymerase III subunit beta [Bradyrhizobium sp. 186]
MKFVVVEGRALKQAMKIVAAIIERRNTIPILGHAKITHSDAGLRITGTDLDLEAHVDLDVIDGAGGEWSACISASVLAGIARVAGTMNVRIERADNDLNATITLGDGAAFYEIETLPETDYPEIGGERGSMIEAFTNGMFAATLDKVRWCVSTEETRYYLNGVCWHVTAKDRRFVATDGHRMAICQYANEGGEASTRIIPRKTVRIVTDHLAGKDVKLFDAGANRIDIVAPGLSIRSKLIDGTYPDYARVLPGRHEFTFNLKRDEIVAAIDQATAIGGDRTTAIKFSNGNGRAVIERRSADFGSAKVKTSTAWPYKGQDDTVPAPFAFNSRYLREVANACQGAITLRMVDQSSPFSIHDEDATMTRVLMPMRA